MEALLLTGLACLGGSIAIGLLTERAVGQIHRTDRPAEVRSLFIIMAALAQGIGVIGTVIGIIAITVARIGGPAASFLAAAPAVVGGIAGLAIAGRSGQILRSIVGIIGIVEIAALTALGMVAGILSAMTGGEGAAGTGGAPFFVLGVLVAVATIGLGAAGATGIEEIGGVGSANVPGVEAPQIETVRQRAIRRIILPEVLAVGAEIVALVLLIAS